MRYVLIFFITLALFRFDGNAQVLKQVIRGTVHDAQTNEALIGAEITIVGTVPLIGTITDVDGNFMLTDVPVGRQSIACNYIGYNPFQNSNVQVLSAKAYFMAIHLTPGVQLDEVVVNAFSRNEAVNAASLISVRRLDPEELQYHAGTGNDPSRLVMGYPGVQQSKDNSNDIVIRGNSSTGILWRLEGIDIPNPNHFAQRGSTGGGITIFSASVLGSSDFLTGAFGAEYGNAISGVFDMHFRNGNFFKRSNTFRAGILGLDYSTEGPISEGKSSYLVNYRYSTLGILNAVGLHVVGPRTDNNFQDISFKLIHKGKKSQLSFWGMGGLSTEKYRTEDMPWQSFSDYEAYDFRTKAGAVGFSYRYLLNAVSSLQVNGGISAQQITFKRDTLSPTTQAFNIVDEDYRTDQLSLNVHYKRAFSTALNMKAGVDVNSSGNALSHKEFDFNSKRTITFLNTPNHPVGRAGTFQPYVMANYRPSKRVNILMGIHGLYSDIGAGTWSLEPRLAMKYAFSDRASMVFSYGQHSKVLPIGTYFTLGEAGNMPNQDLGLIKSENFVIALDRQLSRNMNLHAEFYWQELSNVPYLSSGDKKYWMLNDIRGFAKEALNKGATGRNIGMDLTLEKFFSKGSYFVLSSSVYNSTFQLPNEEKRYNTQYNSQIAVTFTGGQLWQINDRTVLETGMRMLYYKGNPITRILSGNENEDGLDPRLDELHPFDDRVGTYLRPDLRIALRKNKKKHSYWIALDIQNLINRRNEDHIDYNFQTDTGIWEHKLQSGLTPIISFQIDL